MANGIVTVSQVRIKLPNALTGAQTPVTLKNIAGDIPTVQQLRNVSVSTSNGGEILVFNANTNNFDMRDLTGNDVDLSSVNFDGGTF